MKNLVLFLSFLFLTQVHIKADALKTYKDGYSLLKKLEIDLTKVVDVTDFEYINDAGIYKFKSAQIVLTKPVNNKRWSALVIGKGTFEFEPATKLEQDQLFRFYEIRKINTEIESACFFFGDSTIAEWEKIYSFKTVEKVKTAETVLEDAVSSMKFRSNLLASMRIILENKPSDFFYSHIRPVDFDKLIFMIDPNEEEEVIFKRWVNNGSYYETVNKQHLQTEYSTGSDLSNENKFWFSVNKYVINCTIEQDLDMTSKTEMNIIPNKSGNRWMNFTLHSDLVVDSVLDMNSKKLYHVKDEDDYELWIRLPEETVAGKQIDLTLFYMGNIIKRDDLDWFYITGQTVWYPVNRTFSSIHKSKFDIKYTVSDRYDFVGVGQLIESGSIPEFKTYHYVLDEPTVHNSFNLGFFKTHEIRDERIPPVNIYMSKTGHNKIAGNLHYSGVTTGKDMEKQVGEDVVNSILVFNDLFGKSDMKEVRITEIPWSHGQAFPGFVHLSWTTFQVLDNEGFNEFFRAHEVAHQWWGLGVGDKTYHDAWISEGFATFSGLIYMQTVLKDNKKFFAMLNDYKEKILQNRNFLFSTGQQAGPIAMGTRTNSSQTGGDYNLIIYKKGAWVLHMLRNMMLDNKTMKEDRFYNMMKEFYATYKGKAASTEDFKKIVDKHTGMDMKWFFDQWVYGTEVPKYTLTKKEVEQTPDGKYKMSLTIKQENTSPDFQMIVPIKIQFSGDRMARVRYLLKGAESKIVLPLLPELPEDIIINDLESVLCEVEYDD